MCPSEVVYSQLMSNYIALELWERDSFCHLKVGGICHFEFWLVLPRFELCDSFWGGILTQLPVRPQNRPIMQCDQTLVAQRS